MRLYWVVIFLFVSLFSIGQTDTSHYIQVHFLYGSKPLKKYKSTEHKFFGGIHGGHVSIQLDNKDYGFSPEGKFHILPHKNNCHSIYVMKPTNGAGPYPVGTKVTTFIIPVTEQQYESLQQQFNSYCEKPPYDYAFMGMRCAAAAQDVLGKAGILEYRKKPRNVFTTFYPKKLRKRFFKLAKEKNYKIIFQEGRSTRKWEKD